jgi:hypothetical protein
MERKLQRLLRFHRWNVFNEENGDSHYRALMRLKRTKTFIALCENRRERAAIRKGEALERMGY